MAKKASRMTGFSFSPDGEHVYFNGRDGAGRDVCIQSPVAGLRRLVAEAIRRFAAMDRADAASHLPHPWHFTRFLPVGVVDVGQTDATDGQTVALLLDRNSPTEVGLRLSPEDARELGRQLIEAANHSSASQASQH